MDERELDQAIEDCRPGWPANIDNAWVALPAERGGFSIEGPFVDAESAHRISIPAGGRVVYNAADADAAAMIIFNQ